MKTNPTPPTARYSCLSSRAVSDHRFEAGQEEQASWPDVFFTTEHIGGSSFKVSRQVWRKLLKLFGKRLKTHFQPPILSFGILLIIQKPKPCSPPRLNDDWSFFLSKFLGKACRATAAWIISCPWRQILRALRNSSGVISCLFTSRHKALPACFAMVSPTLQYPLEFSCN